MIYGNKVPFDGAFPSGDLVIPEYRTGRSIMKSITVDEAPGVRNYPAGAILHFDADADYENEAVGMGHDFNYSTLSPQYQLNADGSYSNVGAKPAVDVFGGKKWLRSCGQVTNNVWNSIFEGAGIGVSPSGWIADTATYNGITRSIVGFGSGYIDVRFYGTCVGSTSYAAVSMLSLACPVAALSETWTGSAKVTLLSGDWSAVSPRVEVQEFTSAGAYLATSNVTLIGKSGQAVPTSRTLSKASVGKCVLLPFSTTVTVGTTVDFVVRIEQPQLTKTASPMPYVPTTPAGPVTQPASNATTTNGSWFTNPKYIDNVAGAGVGPCPESILPPLMVPMEGCNDPLSPNYGSYTYDNVADMCFIPKFYYKANNTLGYSFGTHGVNTLTIRGSETFASTAAANIAGFALHRAFIDGGIEHAGFFVDKYKCSKVAKGTGFVAGSVKNGLPISIAAEHNPIAELTSVSGNNCAACIDAAKGRDGNNGVKNTSSIFAPISVYQRSALALFSLGYGEAADSNEYCAWYDPNGVTNFPKGCNNNALRDYNDPKVVYQSDGYLNCGKTGSGVPFEKTTHNGQACGVCDLHGLMWEVSIGMTCIATTKSITGATQANPCVLTVPGHGLTTGQIVQVTSVVGMTQLNGMLFTVNVIDANTISLDGVNSTAYTAYASGGSISYGSFYVAKEATRMRDFTSGATLATDHWGAPGVAAMMDEIALPLAAPGGGASMTRYVGSGALSSDISGLGYVLTGIGHPKDAASLAASGVDLFGRDTIYLYIRDQLCVLSGGHWSSGSSAGVFARYLYNSRYYSIYNVGLRCACYPDTQSDPSATPPSILGSKVRSVSPLWSALAGDEVKGSPLTIATRVRMGVGSGDLVIGDYSALTCTLNPYGLLYFKRESWGDYRTVSSYDGANWVHISNQSWSRNSIIRRYVQTSSDGTKFRVGYMIEGTHTAIQWSVWVKYDGSFGPSTLYRLMLGYNNAYPMWYNKITVWKEQVSDDRILAAMS